jgi:hypothetical protein
VIVDVSALDFIDCGALGALLGVRQLAMPGSRREPGGPDTTRTDDAFACWLRMNSAGGSRGGADGYAGWL